MPPGVVGGVTVAIEPLVLEKTAGAEPAAAAGLPNRVGAERRREKELLRIELRRVAAQQARREAGWEENSQDLAGVAARPVFEGLFGSDKRRVKAFAGGCVGDLRSRLQANRNAIAGEEILRRTFLIADGRLEKAAKETSVLDDLVSADHSRRQCEYGLRQL